MLNYKELDFSQIYDRKDLAFSPYIAALDIEYSHFSPYLWSFCFDTGKAVHGRNWDDLKDFFKMLIDRLSLSPAHKLLIIVPNLPEFFDYTKKILPYDPEPTIAKSHREILLIQAYKCIQFHCYEAYREAPTIKDMEAEGIVIPRIDHEALSELSELSQDEIDYSENQVYYITTFFRDELNRRFEGSIAKLALTKTARIERLIGKEQSKQVNKSRCNIKSQIIKMNPMSSEWGRGFLLPLLHKAFFGGVSFFEEGVIDKELWDVINADFSSAYIARMVLDKFPMSKFQDLPRPKSWKELLQRPYSLYAMLITFEAANVELRPGGFAFLPSSLRHSYTDIDSEEELRDNIQKTSSTRIKKAAILRMTLTDIDFRLFVENYTGEIHLLNITGAKYGYLPDYLLNVIVQLYRSKATAKEKLHTLEELGLDTPDEQLAYERIKSEPARLYGIFTKNPIHKKFIYDTARQDIRCIDEQYISEQQKFKPVIYQWGVWTTALVRKHIAYLRRKLKAAPEDKKIQVISGDTDCVNFTGDAAEIIAEYNDNINRLIEKRAGSIGCDPADLKELGCLTTKKYKLYKVTGLKQYCYIRDTDEGEKFGYKVGGMSIDCDYFEKHFKTALQRFRHFGIGLTIPEEYAPRKISSCINEPDTIEYTDRDGNTIINYVLTHSITEQKRFTIYPAMSIKPLSNSPKANGKPFTLEEIKHYAEQLRTPDYNRIISSPQS